MKVLNGTRKILISLGLCAINKNNNMIRDARYVVTFIVLSVTFLFNSLLPSGKYIVEHRENFSELNWPICQFICSIKVLVGANLTVIYRTRVKRVLDGLQAIVDRCKLGYTNFYSFKA